MAKFNVVQRKRRALLAERKRVRKGDPTTGKLKIKPQPLSVSGKRKQKLLKKWRREQKDAIDKGLITMHDVEMSAAEAGAGASMDPFSTCGSQQSSIAAPPSMKMKKKGLKVKQLMGKGKGKKRKKNSSSKPELSSAAVDSMVE